MIKNQSSAEKAVPKAPPVSMEELKRLNASLIRTNNDLMQYAHVASHDLQEPLRKIQLFASVLSESDSLSASDQQIVKKLKASASRVSLLISDLLVHSDVVNSSKMFRPVNLNVVISQIVDDFEIAIREKTATINVGNLPVVSGMALDMNQLFYNLIDNAFKYSDESRPLEISIECRTLAQSEVADYVDHPKPDHDYYDISVKDNGLGFDVRYAEQIYKVFRRLHPKELYKGSGIGLALCRSIVAKHDGVLFAESTPGFGSEFHIIIPQ
ncbi:MAG: hypothetical protein EOO48_06615 [Flavobacterium sp.]|nr:MAG: hypothetical protein EOO48_06615 [Flavobacterium sp.]